MAPRTRATAASVATPAPLAAAPRRRIKVISLEKDKPAVEEATQTIRATRSVKAATDDSEVVKATAKVTTAATKTRARSKKTKTVANGVDKEQPAEIPAEKPKRATRSTRATANTASSVAKAKATTKSSRATKAAPVIEPELQPVPSPTTKVVPRKKVTFQDPAEDDKENQPITTRGSKKTAGSKTTKASDRVTGLRAKPVRNPAVSSTRATKRSKPHDDEEIEDEKPKKIQRILTPKKITQVAKAKIQEEDEDSEDELNGGKTPVRDLSMSPRRPQTVLTADVIMKQLSPMKALNALQPPLLASAKNPESGPLTSPARRPPVSPAKLFSQSTVFSTKKTSDELSHGLTSPARRPLDSPAKLLFPHATKSDQRVQLSQSSNLLFQSPKRSTLFDPAQMFAQSAVKPQKSNLAKSSFFSSPAKRVHIFSPKKSTIVHEDKSDPHASSEIGLDEMEVTELIKHGSTEISVSSHQRASVSPVRAYKLTHDELQMDFDESILPVRSPLKLAKSPAKKVFPEPRISDFIEDEEDTAPFSSLQSTPYQNLPTASGFESPHNIHSVEDVEMTQSEDEGDDTIVLPPEVEVPMRAIFSPVMDMDDSIDELALSPQQDIVAEYLQTPKTPATVYDHEMSNLLSSPNACGTPAATLAEVTESMPSLQNSAQSGKSVQTIAGVEDVASPTQLSSPVILQKNELTAAEDLLEADTTSVGVYENELTMMGGTPKAIIGSKREQSLIATSPAVLAENELTVVGATFTPRSARSQSPVDENEVPASAGAEKSASSPIVLAEHELTHLGWSSVAEDNQGDHGSTPIARPQVVSATPDLPIPRKFSLHTVISKIPLKPEAEESPFRFQLKKRKRPVSLGGQPSEVDFTTSTTPLKTPRTVEKEDISSRRSSLTATPTLGASRRTPASTVSTAKSSRRVASTPLSRSVLTPSADSVVLNGAVVFVDVKTSDGVDASAIYVDLLLSLGAKVSKEWKDGITHVVYKDGSPRILEKARLADIKIVGVSWPLDCEAQQSWVDEAEYAVTLNPVDHLLGSAARSGRRKSMQPSLLVADGSGSVKRSRSKARASTARRSTIKSLNFEQGDSPASADEELATPKADPAKQQAALEKNSLTAAWKSINATSNLGEDTPARRTLELLQKSYELENNWDDTIVSQENDENTPQSFSPREADTEDVEDSIIDTGLTPAPFRTKQQIGSAPSKLHNAGLSSYRDRVEEMERREMRNNAFGTNKGERGLVKGQKEQGKPKGKRMTMFGFDSVAN